MSTSYSPKIVTDGLVVALDAGNRKSYPGSGTTWTDLSGNNNSGSLTNGPIFSNSNLGLFEFDGSNDFVDLGSGSSIQVTNALTLQAWVFPIVNLTETIIATRSINSGSLFPTDWRFMSKAYFNATGTTWGWRNTPNNIDATEISSSVALTTFRWHHVTVTYDLTTVKLYYNGLLDTTATQAGTLTTVYPVRLGQGIGGEKRYFNGLLPTFHMYNRVLSADEVLQNFNATRTRFGV